MKYEGPEFGESLKLTKKEQAKVRAAFKRFENSPGFKRKMDRANEVLRSLQNSSDPETRAEFGGKP